MPIIHIQRSLRQVGRIRIGAQVATRNGKMAPTKLDRFRLSSPQREPIDLAAKLYGGQVVPMTNDKSNDQWEVTTDTASLPVIIPPSNHFDAWMELWSAAGCERRCDGERMIVARGRAADKACECDPTKRECKETTRLFVVLPDLQALGVWRLETHGYYAASELAGAVELCSAATAHGYSLPARLDLEQRTRKGRDDNDKPVTRNFAVPVLSVDVSLPQAQAILGRVDTATGEIPMRTAEVTGNGGGQALPELPASAYPSGATNLPTPPAELPPPPPADIPAPRTHADYEAAQQEPTETPELPLAAPAPAGGMRDDQKYAASLPGNLTDDQRHALYAIVTGDPGRRATGLTGRDKARVQKYANDIHQGHAALKQYPTGWALEAPDGDLIASVETANGVG